MSDRRLRLLVINQYYWPGVEATAHILSQLCEDLARDLDVTVITGCLRGIAETPGKTRHAGVEIVRVRSTSFDRSRILGRGLNYASFLGSSLLNGLRVKRPDIVLCMTDPPVISDVALPIARRFRVPLVVITQDIFPEVAVKVGRLTHPVVVELFRRLTSFATGRAESVVAIGETMRDRLEAKGIAPDRISVIPNWADTGAVSPRPRDNGWSRSNGFAGRFVVMHSGNIGYAQDLDALIRATTFLRDLSPLAVVVIGTGARQQALRDLAHRSAADAVQFLPYQPAEVISESLSAADIHFVGLASGLGGYVVPSRLYGIMAVARPILVSADADSDTARLVSELGCGIVVPPGHPECVAEVLREVHEGRHDLDAMGQRGYEYVSAVGNRVVAVGRYRDLLDSLARPV